jgi:hypothetical protein
MQRTLEKAISEKIPLPHPLHLEICASMGDLINRKLSCTEHFEFCDVQLICFIFHVAQIKATQIGCI